MGFFSTDSLYVFELSLWDCGWDCGWDCIGLDGDWMGLDGVGWVGWGWMGWGWVGMGGMGWDCILDEIG